jgi:hypothetical protein
MSLKTRTGPRKRQLPAHSAGSFARGSRILRPTGATKTVVRDSIGDGDAGLLYPKGLLATYLCVVRPQVSRGDG